MGTLHEIKTALWSILRFIVLCLLPHASLFGQEKKPAPDVDPKQIEVALVPEHETICLGEPAWFDFTVTNNSPVNLQISVGGDYQNAFGRPDSFTVTVVDRDGVQWPKPGPDGNGGGMVSPNSLPAGGKYQFRLFLSHWATLTETGAYTITARRTLNLFTGTFFKIETKMDLPVEATARFQIVPADPEKLGRLIDEVGARLLAPRTDASQQEDWTTLLQINDTRIVPYLLQAFAQNDYSMKFEALEGLAKFDTDEAYEGLKRGMTVTSGEVGEATTEALRQSLADGLHHAAAAGLSRSPHPAAIPFLLAQRKNTSYAVRLTAVHAMKQKLSPNEAVPLLQEMVGDENQMVSGEAKRYLKEIAEGK